jgi:hypothetical protein
VVGDIPIKLKKLPLQRRMRMKIKLRCLEQLYDDGKRMSQVPLFYGGDAEVMIHTVRKFQEELADDLEFAEAHKKFMNFR